MMKTTITCMLCMVIGMLAYGQTGFIKGQVLDETSNRAIVNASVQINGIAVTNTDSTGYFEATATGNQVEIRVSHIGFQRISLTLALPQGDALYIRMTPNARELEEVSISTGYEEIPLERATGSFEKIDNALLNRGVGMDVLGRIADVTTGIHFEQRNTSFNAVGRRPDHDIYVHGISTLRAGATGRNAPLIVLDNFPYEGDINNINPNDIESITILKDAAAASIWGAKAGNGVIVITSKRARFGDKIKLAFTSNAGITAKPDLFRHQVIAPSDYIDVEKFLFDRGFYNSAENSRARPALQPVVELLIKQRDGLLSEQEVKQRIDSYRQQDVRDDMLKYMYREAIQQQYALNMSGGSKTHRFMGSVGYDTSLPSQIGNKNSRLTLRLENTFKLTDRMEVQAIIRWVNNRATNTTRTETYSESGYNYPYIKLADEQGNAVAVPKDYRMGFLDTAGAGRLLDWHYRPLDEIRNPPVSISGRELMVNLGIGYEVASWLRADIKYQFGRNDGTSNEHHDINSYYARNQINRGTQLDGNTPIYHFPYGGILTDASSVWLNYYGRGQLSANRQWGERHRFNALFGMDINEQQNRAASYSLYGYDENVLTFASPVDHTTRFPVYGNLATSGRVPYPLGSPSETMQRFVSLFANASYTYQNRYTISMSARRDASNLFGVTTNNKWTPLWSAGFSWNISDEDFYTFQAIPFLKMRVTNGYSGNIDNTMAAVPTLSYTTVNSAYDIPFPAAQIQNGFNPQLRWEKVRNINFGIDFTASNGVIGGSVDIYQKKTQDLFDAVPMDPSTGLSTMTINAANTKSRGVDARITSHNLRGKFGWRTDWLFSYNNNWIERSYRDYTGPSLLVKVGNLSYTEGTYAFPALSYKWGGLDPQTGEPRGIIDGQPSKDYNALTGRDAELEDLVFHGSARPLYFGSIRNAFTYSRLSLSANISWRFAYYFRREGLDFDNLLYNSKAHTDYYKRWQQAGDEVHTDVPAFIYPANSRANTFYRDSEVLIEKGDHIRLNDIRLDYNVDLVLNRRPINVNLFVHAANLGILWRANRLGLDPINGGSIPMPRSYRFGININL